MEIINYIQDKPRRPVSGLNLPAFGLGNSRRNKYTASPYSLAYTPEKQVSLGTRFAQIDVKAFLIALGQQVSAAGNFVKSHIRQLALGVLVIIFVLAAAGVGGYALVYARNHTGRIHMNYSGSVDISNLDALMASFALDGSTEVDADGNLLDAQVSVRSYTQPVSYQKYTVKAGDTISGIARRFGLSNISTLISVNDIGNVRQLGAGQKLKIPSMDGILYTVQKGDSISSISTKNNVKVETLVDVNELSDEELAVGQQLFLPGVSLDSKTLRNAMGELFRLPISRSFRWTSPYGWRNDPIKGVRSFHTGTDMACPEGTPIGAAMSGRISFTGWSNVFGNYVIINHDNGYQTLYAHMSKIIATKGQWVSQGTTIGLVGTTGYSTGPHLHFTVYKNGKLVDPMTVLK